MRLGTALLAALVSALSTIGADAETLTDAECRLLDARIRADLPKAAGPLAEIPTLTAAPGGCRTGAVEFGTGGSDRIVTMINDIVVDGVGLRAYAETGAPPTEATLRFDRFRVVPRIGDPAMDFAFEAQHARSGVRGALVVFFDRTANRIVLKELSLDFPGPNGVVISAEASGIDSTSRDALLASAATAKLTKARLEVDTRGLFESYLLMPLAPIILAGADDAALAFEAWKSELRNAIAATPDETLPAMSKDALGGLLQDLPNPYGRLIVDLTYPGGFGLVEAMALGEARLERPDDWIDAPFVADVEYLREDPDDP